MTDFAKSSAHNLCEEFKTIFNNYQKYGNTVLDVDLKDEPEIREIFLKSETLEDYKKNIKEFWAQNFQIVISKCSDIEKAYNSRIYDSDILVVTDLSESNSLDSNAVVLVDFFNRLGKDKSPDFTTNTHIAYVETDKFIYQINLWKMNKDRFIKINKKRIPKDSIVTD